MSILIKYHTCSRERTGIDIDAVCQHFRFFNRGVAVHNDFAEIQCAVQKLVTNS